MQLQVFNGKEKNSYLRLSTFKSKGVKNETAVFQKHHIMMIIVKRWINYSSFFLREYQRADFEILDISQ